MRNGKTAIEQHDDMECWARRRTCWRPSSSSVTFVFEKKKKISCISCSHFFQGKHSYSTTVHLCLILQTCKSIPLKWDTSKFMDVAVEKYGQRVEPFQKAPDKTYFVQTDCTSIFTYEYVFICR